METTRQTPSVSTPLRRFFNRLRSFVWQLFQMTVGPEAARAFLARWRGIHVAPAPQRTTRQPAVTRVRVATSTGFIARLRAFFGRFMPARSASTSSARTTSVVSPIASFPPIPPVNAGPAADAIISALSIEEILAKFNTQKELFIVPCIVPDAQSISVVDYAKQNNHPVILIDEEKNIYFFEKELTGEPLFLQLVSGEYYKLQLKDGITKADMLEALAKVSGGVIEADADNAGDAGNILLVISQLPSSSRAAP